MKQIRCNNCNKLLAKTDGKGQIEIKCPRCKEINILKTIESPINGSDYGQAKDVRKERI